jgi:hypothetical protein
MAGAVDAVVIRRARMLCPFVGFGDGRVRQLARPGMDQEPSAA